MNKQMNDTDEIKQKMNLKCLTLSACNTFPAKMCTEFISQNSQASGSKEFVQNNF